MPACKDPEKERLRREKIGKASKGHKLSPETIEQIRQKNIGKKRSPEYCQWLSEQKKGKMAGENHPMFGKHHSEESKQKMRKPHKKPENPRVISPELREKLSLRMKKMRQGNPSPNKGKKLPKEWCDHLSAARKGIFAGEKNPAWKGGISFEPYCPKFTKEFRERVRAFFGFTCQKCGHVWKEGEPKLSVHHVNYRKDACCDPNVIPLFVPVCSGSCHSQTNRNREKWEKFFTDIINEKFGGKCYFSKEEMKEHG